MCNDKESIKKLIDNELNVKFSKYVKLFGITNIAIFLAFISYIIFIIPNEAYEKASVNIKSDLQEFLKPLYEDIFNGYKQLSKIESLKENVAKFKDEVDCLRIELPELDNNLKEIKSNVESFEMTDIALITKAAKRIRSDQDFMKIMKYINEIEGNSEDNVIRFGSVQICWGVVELTSKNKHNTRKNIAYYTFKFPKPFKEKPVVANGINHSSSGYGSCVYVHEVTKDSYYLGLSEMQGRDWDGTVFVNYLAIGRWE